MDLIRDQKPRKRKRWIQGIAAGVVVLSITVGVSTLEPASPSLDRGVIWTDTVRHGTLIRMVRGPGTLVPEQRRLITAVTSGRVEEILVLPGTELDPSTVFLRLSNPDVEMQLLEARQNLSDAQTRLLTLRSDLERGLLTQSSALIQLRSQRVEAERQHGINQALADRDPAFVAAADLLRSGEVLEDVDARLALEERRMEMLEASVTEQIAAQENNVERLRNIVEFQENRVASLLVTAPAGGVLAEISVEEGQWVSAGGSLGRVVQPGRLRAEIQIPQTQAQDIVVGQTAMIDTRSDTIQGHVSRIDPTVTNGTVRIDITLPDSLPRSARPDLNIDGTVVIERLEEVTYVSRPAYGQANARVGLFRLTPDGEYAERVSVGLGRSSVNEIEVQDGLRPGDVVILSDMSQWDGFDRVRIR